MSLSVDSKTKEQVEEFHRRLEAMKQYHEAAVFLLATDRIMRDIGMLHTPISPRVSGWQRAGQWFAQKVAINLRRRKPEAPQSQDESPIIVIESTCRDVSTTYEDTNSVPHTIREV